MFDPACGTGGMLTGGQELMRALNPRARLEVFGQERNPETWAIARSDLMIKGQDLDPDAGQDSSTEENVHRAVHRPSRVPAAHHAGRIDETNADVAAFEAGSSS